MPRGRAASLNRKTRLRRASVVSQERGIKILRGRTTPGGGGWLQDYLPCLFIAAALCPQIPFKTVLKERERDLLQVPHFFVGTLQPL